MAAGTFDFYNKFKEYMADGTLDLDANTFDIHLSKSTGNYATKTLSTYGSLTDLLTDVNAVKQLSNVLWTTGASAGQMKFDADDVVMTASGSAFTSIFAAIITQRAGASDQAPTNRLIAFVTLSTTQFSVSTGNTLTITMPATGIFTLT